jgi:hypothetical protein
VTDATAPAPGAGAPQLRALGIGEQLDVALKICTTHWRPLIKAVLLPVVPASLLITLFTVSTLPEGADGDEIVFGADPTTTSDADFAALVGGQVAGALLSIAVALLVFGACFRVIAEAYVGAGPDWRESIRFALRRAPSLLWLSILYTLGLVLGFVALIVPGIILSVRWAVAYPVLFAEDLRGSKALRRSWRLVKGRWWATAAVLAIGYVISSILALVGTFAFGLLVLVDSSSVVLGVLASIVSNIASQAISAPIIAAVLAVTYFDLRVRKEGFDLELLARGIGTRHDPATAAERLGLGSSAPAAGGEPPPFWPPPPGWSPGGAPAPGEGRWAPPTPPPDERWARPPAEGDDRPPGAPA